MKKTLVKAMVVASTLLVGAGSAFIPTVSAEEVVTVEISQEEETAFQEEDAANELIQVGYNGGTCLGVLGVAQALGFYEEEGLNTEIISMSSANDSLGTGQADISGDHIATAMVPMANGVNFSMVTGAHTGCKSIYVATDSDIETTADLVGQILAVPDGMGASDQNIAFRFFKADGIDPLSINYRQVDSGAAVQAIENGEVQGVVLNDQFAREFVDSGQLRYVRALSYDEDFSWQPCCGIYINNDFQAENPIATKKLTRAIQKTREWIVENPEEYVNVMIENNWATGDIDIINDYIAELDYGVTDSDTEESLKMVISDYKEFGFIDDSMTDEELLEMVWRPQH